jgi:hypothetical protein
MVAAPSAVLSKMHQTGALDDATLIMNPIDQIATRVHLAVKNRRQIDLGVMHLNGRTS